MRRVFIPVLKIILKNLALQAIRDGNQNKTNKSQFVPFVGYFSVRFCPNCLLNENLGFLVVFVSI